MILAVLAALAINGLKPSVYIGHNLRSRFSPYLNPQKISIQSPAWQRREIAFVS
jgi:hypothetical protein